MSAVLDEPKVESVKATRIDSMITYPDKAWQESERIRLEAAKPDIEKLHNFGKQIRSLSCPGLQSDWARNAVHTATVQLAEIAEVLEAFQAEIPY